MLQDRVLVGTFWSDERFAGLPPAGRLAYLFICSNADRDGYALIDPTDLASAIGMKPTGSGEAALMLLSVFNLCLAYGDGMVWLPDFSETQPSSGKMKIPANFALDGPDPSELREFLSQRIGRIATEKECKDICPRAYGLKRQQRCKEYDGRVREIWEAWRERQTRPDSCSLTPSVQRTIRGAMKEAQSNDLIKLIEYAYEADDAPAKFWRGENVDKRKYLGLDNLFRIQKLQGRMQLVFDWISRKNGMEQIDEIDLGPYARRM